MTTDANRASNIVACFASTFGTQTTKRDDPRQVFERLAQHVEGLEPSELAGAAAAAKQVATELNSLTYRLAQAEAEAERRRTIPPR
jgi:hypothetical protein